MKQAQGFLQKGEQVQLLIQLRGRQNAHPERAIQRLNELSEVWLEEYGKAANTITLQRLSVTYNPKKR